jgi:DNA-binding transcriptional ArsR family regulator
MTTDALLAKLDALRAGVTMCPGELARRLGTTQAKLRPSLLALAEAGRIAITQRGAPADLRTLRGPYRVALLRDERLAER